jgi:hypothetical protein
VGGAASSLGGRIGSVSGLDVFVGVDIVPVSWSLSKSNGRAVVGDSGGPSEGLSGETGDDCGHKGQVLSLSRRYRTYCAVVCHVGIG